MIASEICPDLVCILINFNLDYNDRVEIEIIIVRPP